MKYIISENRLNEIITEYLNSWIENKVVSNHRDFILIEEKANDYDEWETLMEYDFSDGRLWVNRNLVRFLVDLFGKNEIDVRVFVGEWFGKNFNVDVEFVE
jgi:hypothetical protein